jgi:ABC-type sulfate/molybdate transport systems ATPase subunit
VLCLDEPLSALDDASRAAMHDLLRTIRSQAGVTTLHITHNADDARQLADRVLVLDAGRVGESRLDPSVESIPSPSAAS